MAKDDALKRLSNLRRPANWLIACLESAQASEGTGRFDPGHFHPSDFGNECDAFMAFRFLGAPSKQVIEPKLQRIFDYGNIRETYLRHYLQNAGISIVTDPSERRIEIPSLYIVGELDEVVANPITKEKFIVDYKTMHMDRFEKLETAVPGHRLQVHPYMFAKEIYKAFVLYECKNDQRLKAMPTDFDGKLWQTGFVERVDRVLTGIQKNEVYRNPAHCTGCPFFANGVCTANQIQKLKEESGLKFP